MKNVGTVAAKDTSITVWMKSAALIQKVDVIFVCGAVGSAIQKRSQFQETLK